MTAALVMVTGIAIVLAAVLRLAWLIARQRRPSSTDQWSAFQVAARSWSAPGTLHGGHEEDLARRAGGVGNRSTGPVPSERVS